MKRDFTIDLSDVKSINRCMQQLQDYSRWLHKKADQLAKKLADMGVVNASIEYSRAIYTGNNDITVRVEQKGEGRYAITADGEALLFIEFGTGITFSYVQHPQNADFGMGPGTYPEGVGHWDDPRGWYLPGSGSVHTYGNPPSMTMYETAKGLREQLQEIAQEVFSRD